MSFLRSLTLSVITCVYSTSVLSATVANFNVSGLDGAYDGNGAFINSGNGQYTGTATLYETGLLTLTGSLTTFVPSSETGGLGDISTSITAEMHFTGSLVGNILSGISVTSYTTLSCQDTGSTGLFAGNACANVLDPEIFNVFTDPLAFDFAPDGLSTIDWNGSHSSVGSLTAEQSVSRTTFSTVPIPAGLWLFASGLIGIFISQRRRSPSRGI